MLKQECFNDENEGKFDSSNFPLYVNSLTDWWFEMVEKEERDEENC